MKKLIAIASLSLLAAPAAACDFRELPWQTHASNIAIVGDVISTKYCLDRGSCKEANPFYGKHPSDGRLFGVGAGRIALNTGIACFLEDRDPRAARIFSTVSLAINGGIFAANLRFVF